MCGRYVSPDQASIEREFSLLRGPKNFPESFNVAPTQPVPIIRHHGEQATVERLRWGLIPFFARGIAPTYATFNARMETVQTAASFRGPWRRGQRCLIAARGFYEWQVQADGKTKVPYYIHLNDQPIFAFAGLWDASQTAAGETVESCVHLTMPANALVAQIHNTKHRMPAILSVQDRETWLTGSADAAWAALRPYREEFMVAWPVSTRVNKPANNDEQLIVAAQPAVGAAPIAGRDT